METIYQFSLAEVKAIYRIIEHEWINRDDEEAIRVADRISRIVNNDMGNRSCRTTPGAREST